jgi:predicted ATP-grasp superfamily ATP-dependent carboligase
MRFIFNTGKELPESPSFICALPSHGNVGQLAADVVIATLAQTGQIERIGYVESEYVIPMTGYDQFSPSWGKTLCMPIEGLRMIRLLL